MKGILVFLFVISVLWMLFGPNIAALLFGADVSGESRGKTTLTITDIFFKVILTLFLVGLIQLFVKWKRAAGFAGSIPSYVTAIGVLGTFVGIFVGLYKFDVNDLTASVPRLLEGMKLAFSTSIAGLTTSTVLRATHSIFVSVSGGDDPWAAPMGTSGSGTGGASFSDLGLTMLMAMTDEEFEERLGRLRRMKKEIREMMDDLKDLKNGKYRNSF